MHKGKMASKREMEVTTQEDFLPWTTPDTDEGRECFPSRGLLSLLSSFNCMHACTHARTRVWGRRTTVKSQSVLSFRPV